VVTINKDALDKVGLISAARVVHPDDALTVMTSKGLVLRTDVKDVSRAGRSARGVRLMEMQNGDTVASLGRIRLEE
jgi:DNA gyrase subunit A